MRGSRGIDYSRQRKAAFIGLFLAAACIGLGAGRPKPVLRSLPLSFEANQGQTDPTVKFFARGNGYALFLTSDTAVFRLVSSRAHPARPGLSPSVVRMKLAGANPSARVAGAGALPGKINYFIGNDARKWTTGAGTYRKVT